LPSKLENCFQRDLWAVEQELCQSRSCRGPAHYRWDSLPAEDPGGFFVSFTFFITNFLELLNLIYFIDISVFL
jgi:hypothetical protein